MKLPIIATLLGALAISACTVEEPPQRKYEPTKTTYTRDIFNIGEKKITSNSKFTRVGTKNIIVDGTTTARLELWKSGRNYHIELLGTYDEGLGDTVDRWTSSYKIKDIYLWSPGGYVREGFKTAAGIRGDSVRAHVIDGTTCASSCTLTFISGVERDIEGTGTVAVHAPYVNNLDGTINCSLKSSRLGTYWGKFSRFMLGNYAGNRFWNDTFSRCSATNLIEYDRTDTWLQRPNYNANVMAEDVKGLTVEKLVDAAGDYK